MKVHSDSMSAIKRNTEFELVSVPRDPIKRMKYFAEQTNSLIQSLAGTSSAAFTSPAVPREFSFLVDESSEYQEYDDSIQLNKNFVAMQDVEVQNDIASVAGVFMNCTVQSSNGVSFLLTSFGVFVHNNSMVDDCAAGLTLQEYRKKPFAVVTKNSHLQSATYFELSIFFGFYEILATGGYYSQSNRSVVPFLGSSLPNWQHDAMEDGNIQITGMNMKHSIQASARLLNQYRKQNSHNLWGFYSTKTNLLGFVPVNPLKYKNHTSQKSRDSNIYHFASQLLSVASSPTTIGKSHIGSLFLMFVSTKAYREICKVKPTRGFNEFNVLLGKGYYYLHHRRLLVATLLI